MNFKNTIVLLLIMVLGFTSCKDDEAEFIPVPPRDRTEQQIADNDSILDYLETHYYNSSVFETPGNYSYSDIIISEMPQDESGAYYLPNPENNTILIDALETVMVNGVETIAHPTVFNNVDYVYYVLKINQGGGPSPNFTDDIKINYAGNILADGDVFDSTVNADNPLDLFNLIPAWRDVLQDFGTASNIIDNPDGTVDYEDYGFGVMFIPSGLAYFNSPPFGIPVYSNLVFKFELYQAQANDQDEDFIPTHLEDLNSNENITDDDTDGDTFPNFFDPDDDGDGTLTKDEVEKKEYDEDQNMMPFSSRDDAQSFFDTYAASNEFLISIIANNNGTFNLNTVVITDSNDDGTPDYLDSSVN